MRRIIIIGNFGSGKSTLAKKFVVSDSLAHLDLDEITWLPGFFAHRRMPLEQSLASVNEFTASNESWVIEGMYVDILENIAPLATELYFMDIPETRCIENGKDRPWEPHKFESKEAQDANLQRLIRSNWIQGYATRDDIYSYKAHQAFFDSFRGKKVIYSSYEKAP